MHSELIPGTSVGNTALEKCSGNIPIEKKRKRNNLQSDTGVNFKFYLVKAQN